MSKRNRYIFVILLLLALSAGLMAYALRSNKLTIGQYSSIARPARIRPDYCDTVIPPNIAPLNFIVEEDGSYYCVKIYSTQGRPIELFSRSPKIMIPQKQWHQLLDMNKGKQLYFDVFVKTADTQWRRFSPITNKIAYEEIDNYLVYRKINPGHDVWGEIGCYQRDLRSYNESVIIKNNSFDRGCVNCHAFCNNRTDKMLIDIRSRKYGSSALMVNDGLVSKIGQKLGFISWHPSGRVIACSVSKPGLVLHTTRNYVQDIAEFDSVLVYYVLDSKTIKTSPKIAQKDRLELYPCWAPDGRYLYFSSAPMLWSGTDRVPPERFDEVRYDLVRISYDLGSDTWGQLETVLSAEDTHLSILQPRISPDGRWLLCCMCDYGSWPVHRPSSDLYLIDLKAAQQTGRYQYRRLDINSDQSESWHSWSTNSRWLAFSSKRGRGVFTRSYFSYVDRKGKVYKPILMPQKDPAFYDSCLKTYTVPEFVIEPVKAAREKLARVVRSSAKISVDMPVTMATPGVGIPTGTEPWQGERE